MLRHAPETNVFLNVWTSPVESAKFRVRLTFEVPAIAIGGRIAPCCATEQKAQHENEE